MVRMSSHSMLVLHMYFHLTNFLTLRREKIVLSGKNGDMRAKTQGFEFWL